jgi:hypothetical protein
LIDLDLYIMILNELCLKDIFLLSYLCIIWLHVTFVKKLRKEDIIMIRAIIKSPKVSMALIGIIVHVDFHKEWFRDGDLNSFRDIRALPVSGGWDHSIWP